MQQDRRRQGKLWLSVLTAICGLPVILGISDALWLEAIALILFACLVVLTVSLMRAGSYLIIAVLVVIGIAILPSIPDMAALREAGQFVLVFGCLMPVLTLICNVNAVSPANPEAASRITGKCFGIWASAYCPYIGGCAEYWHLCAHLCEHAERCR